MSDVKKCYHVLVSLDAIDDEDQRGSAVPAGVQMKITGIEGLTLEEIRFEIARGGRFVIFKYCVSIVIFTFRFPSKVVFLRAGESGVRKGLPYLAVSVVLGWWGIPWGPIFTIQSIGNVFGGGEDITYQVMAALNPIRASSC